MAQQKKGLKTIKEIIESTNSVEGYEGSSLSSKPMGSIYLYNKRIKAKPKSSIVEISMMIKGVTDFINSKSGKRPVAAHKVLIAIRGVEQEEVTATALVERIRKENPTYADENTYSFSDIISLVQGGKTKFFDGKTILMTEKKTYVIINDNISPDCYMKVWCSCSSYYWVFQWYNVDNNVDIRGKRPERYTYARNSMSPSRSGKEVTSRMAPLRNPKRAFGMCKHLTLLLGMLMDEEVVANASKGSNDPGVAYAMNADRFQKVDRLSYAEYDKLSKKWKTDQRSKTSQRRQYIYGSKSKVTKNFAQKNNPNIVHKKFNWKKGL